MNKKLREFKYKGVLVEIYEDGFTLGYYENEWKSFIEFMQLQTDEEIKSLIDVIFNATRSYVKTELNKLLGI